MTRQAGAVLGMLFLAHAAGAEFTQQGSKLIGTTTSGNPPLQGTSVALSADGHIAIVGGHGDNAFTGAAWVFARNDGVWSHQGSKLVGSDALPGSADQGSTQGASVAISADGNIAIVGGLGDNAFSGAAWVFTSSGGVWSQQGSKLVGTGAVGDPQQGWSVSISADGNTAIVGGRYDNARAGAAWVFTRSAGVWSQQGSKLVGTGAVGSAYQGCSVAISADGNTAIVGGPNDNSAFGAAWVFFSPSASTYSVWVPVAAHNSGLNESRWRSDLGLLNTGSGTANAQVKFFGGGGIVSNTTYVPPGTQSILTDVVEQVGASGQGALEVVSDRPLRVTSRTYNRVSSGAGCYPNGTQGQDYPTLTASDGLSAGQSAYLAGLTENASYRCNIGLVNVLLGPATVLVELYDGAGMKLTDYTVSLAAGQWVQETQPFRNRAGQTAMDRGYARVTVTSATGTGVFAFASLVDNVTNDPTTITMQR